MKNLWIISVLFVALFWNANTMPVKQDSSENGQQLVPSPKLRDTRSVPVTEYRLKNPTFDLLVIPEWHQLILQNRVFWGEICLKGSRYKNIELFAPLRIRVDMPMHKIENSLRAAFHPQEIVRRERFITVLN